MKPRSLVLLLALCCVVPAITQAARAAVPHRAVSAAPTVTGVSPAVGRRRGGNTVTITGTGLGAVTKVLFGTTAATGITHPSSTILSVAAPAHASGTVGVRVTSPAGTSATTTTGRYTYVEFSPHLTWTAAAAIPSGRADAVSCPTSTFCVAAGLTVAGDVRAAVFSGGRWHAPVVIDQGVRAGDVSCSSNKLCQVAVTHDAAGAFSGYAVAYRSGTWTATQLLTSGDTALTGVDCPSDTYCLATSESGAGYVYDGSDWAPIATHYPGGTAAPAPISCATRNYCVLASDYPWIGTGVAWGRGATGSSADGSASDVSCGATTLCVVTTEGEDAAPATYAFDGAAASDTPNPLASGSISCASALHCVVVKGTQFTVAKQVT